MAAKKVFVAKESFTTSIGGKDVMVRAGKTTVAEGHALLKGRRHLFELHVSKAAKPDFS